MEQRINVLILVGNCEESNCHQYAKCTPSKCVCKPGYSGDGEICNGRYKKT